MITKYVDVDNQAWGFLVIYDFDVLDFDNLAAIMDTFGMREGEIREALRVLSEPNTGMAVSRSDLRMSAIFIGETTSNDEFWSTVTHELKHVHDTILDYYDVGLDGEPSAYTMGYLLQQVVKEIAQPCY